MDQELVRHFIEECKRDQEWAERWASNHIEFDNYFKYSGQFEKSVPMIEQHYSAGKYGMMLKAPILRSKDPVVRWYFQNPNEPMYDIAIRFNITYKEVSNKISKYLKTRTNDQGKKIFA